MSRDKLQCSEHEESSLRFTAFFFGPTLHFFREIFVLLLPWNLSNDASL